MFLAWKELFHAKFRYVMMTAIIVLIAWLVFILSGLGNGLSTLSAATLKNLDADYVMYDDMAGATFSKSVMSASAIDELKNDASVKDYALFGSSSISVAKDQTKDADKKVDAALLGTTVDSYIMPEIIEGTTLSKDEPNGVVVNETLKDEGYKIGDELIVSSSKLKLTIVGFVENETFNHLPSIFVNIDTWREYQYAVPESNNGITDPVQAIIVKAPDLNVEKWNKKLDDTELVTKNEAVMGMPGYKAESGTIYLMLAFCIVISAFVIAVFFYVITMQKTQQFGVMKAIGASNKFISKTIVAQVFIVSVIGILIGIALTYLTAMILPEGMPFNLSISLVTSYSFIMLVISLLSSLVSVRQISKIDPLQALGRVE